MDRRFINWLQDLPIDHLAFMYNEYCKQSGLTPTYQHFQKSTPITNEEITIFNDELTKNGLAHLRG